MPEPSLHSRRHTVLDVSCRVRLFSSVYIDLERSLRKLSKIAAVVFLHVECRSCHPATNTVVASALGQPTLL